MKENHDSYIFVICLNPKCPEPSSRCMDSQTIRKHAIECSRYYYSADTLMHKTWQQIDDYPNDPVGMAIRRKMNTQRSGSFFTRILQEFRENMMKQINEFENNFYTIYPPNFMEQKFSQIYGLERVVKALKEESSAEYISKVINQNFSHSKFFELTQINEKLDSIVLTFQNIVHGLSQQLKSVLGIVEKSQSLEKTMPSGYDKKIECGLLKSKFITSSKISVDRGVIEFPKLKNIASFLPWLYSDRAFTTGDHCLKISSTKFPTIFNSGFTVLEENDIDTYPYTYFKSLFNKESKGFKLISGSEIEHLIGATTSVILRVELGPSPKAVIMDSQLRCKYECELEADRSYRLGLYGSGWGVTVTALH